MLFTLQKYLNWFEFEFESKPCKNNINPLILNIFEIIFPQSEDKK